jgi:hypothetical protein
MLHAVPYWPVSGSMDDDRATGPQRLIDQVFGSLPAHIGTHALPEGRGTEGDDLATNRI